MNEVEKLTGFSSSLITSIVKKTRKKNLSTVPACMIKENQVCPSLVYERPVGSSQRIIEDTGLLTEKEGNCHKVYYLDLLESSYLKIPENYASVSFPRAIVKNLLLYGLFS